MGRGVRFRSRNLYEERLIRADLTIFVACEDELCGGVHDVLRGLTNLALKYLARWASSVFFLAWLLADACGWSNEKARIARRGLREERINIKFDPTKRARERLRKTKLVSRSMIGHKKGKC